MSKIVTDANGRKHVFPDESTPEMIAQAMGVGVSDKFKTYTTNRVPAPSMAANVKRGTEQADAFTRNVGLPSGLAQIDPQTGKPNWFQKARDVTDVAYRPLAEGATLSLGDEARALGGGVADAVTGGEFQQGYDKTLASERAGNERVTLEHPVSSIILKIIGSLGTGMGAKGVAAVPLLTKGQVIKQGAKVGAGFGAVAGFGSGEGTEGRMTGAAIGGGAGGVLGATLPMIGAGISSLIARYKNVPSIAPTIEQLKIDSTEAYKLASDSNFVISQPAVKRFADSLLQSLKGEGFHPKLHTRAQTAIDELGTAAEKDISFNEYEVLRRIANSAKNSSDRDEQRVGGIITQKMDGFLTKGLQPSDVVGGDAAAATKAIVSGRELWGRARKAELVEEAIERANLNTDFADTSKIANQLRQQFKALLTNKATKNRWTPEEKAMLREVSGGTISRGFLRWLGKLSPESGVVMPLLQAGLAYPTSGATLVPMAAGFVAKRANDAMTRSAANRALASSITGQPAVPATVGALPQNLVRSFSQAAGANVGNQRQRRSFGDLR